MYELAFTQYKPDETDIYHRNRTNKKILIDFACIKISIVLLVKKSTTFSPTLQALIDAGKIILVYITKKSMNY